MFAAPPVERSGRSGYQHSLGVRTTQFWLFGLGKIPHSVILTWTCNNSRRSTAFGLLLHSMINLVGELLESWLLASQEHWFEWIVAGCEGFKKTSRLRLGTETWFRGGEAGKCGSERDGLRLVLPQEQGGAPQRNGAVAGGV